MLPAQGILTYDLRHSVQDLHSQCNLQTWRKLINILTARTVSSPSSFIATAPRIYFFLKTLPVECYIFGGVSINGIGLVKRAELQFIC